MKNLIIILVSAVLLGGCSANYEKTKSGLRYKIIKGKGGAKLKDGDFVKFNQIVTMPEKDTVLNTTYGKMPGYVKIDTGARTEYSYLEVMRKMSVGDSAVIVLSIDTLKKRNMIPDYDNVLKRGGQITFKIRILKKYSSEAEVNADYQKDMEAENLRQQKEAETAQAAEGKALEEYIKKNNIKAVKTPSGAYVEVQQQGSGPKVDSGTIASIFYTGKLLKDGTSFDSNRDPKFNHTQAYDVSVGVGGTIRGLDEGLRIFSKGGKGRVFIPSVLAYGPKGAAPVIPPSASLIFEIEVADVKPAPARPQTPPVIQK